MFENSSVMLVVEKNGELEVCKIETDRKTQKVICEKYAEMFQKKTIEKEIVSFDGKYKPEQDEILYIENFKLENNIQQAIEAPAGVSTFIPNLVEKTSIKFVFVGEKRKEQLNIVFQKFKKEQYISTKGINLFYDKNTFVAEDRFGICISDEIDCIYSNGKLLFDSYYMARQVFDLQDYYRSATEEEVESFTKLDAIKMDNPQLFKGQADSRVRKKIASIMDSKVLEKYPAKEIRKMGKSTGVDIPVKNNKVIIPEDKKQMKIVLGFLDEEVYKGVFSKDTFITNSKRTIA